MDRVFGLWGTNAVTVLVMLSALGAINGMILTGTRIYAVWAADYPALNWLATWNRQRVAPVVAITIQALVAVFLILLVMAREVAGARPPGEGAAARALLASTKLDPAEIVKRALEIAADICVYTNANITVLEL